LDMGHF